jgi:hypothetical protein
MEVLGINTWARDISSIDKRAVSGQELAIARPAGIEFCSVRGGCAEFFERQVRFVVHFLN